MRPHLRGWSPGFGWVPTPRIPKPKFQTKTVVVTFPKFDFSTVKQQSKTLGWKLVPKFIKTKIARMIHENEVRARYHPEMLKQIGEKQISEYVDFDWNLRTMDKFERQEAVGSYLGLEIEQTGRGFTAEVPDCDFNTLEIKDRTYTFKKVAAGA